MLAKIAYRLVAPYWRSADKKNGILLLVVILSIAAVLSYLRIWYNDWYVAFYNAFQKLEKDKFWSLIPIILGVAALALCLEVVNQFSQNWLELRWRRGLVSDFISRWFRAKAFYRIERNQEGDNPDQRIAEDVKTFVKLTMSLSIEFVTVLMTLGSFSYLTWTKGGDFDFEMFGQSYTLYGFMFWLALAYSVVNTALTHLAGRRLIAINFATEAAEADFRYSLVQVRDHAEQIALYGGEQSEKESLWDRFVAVWRVYKQNYSVAAQLMFANGSISLFSMFLPLMAMSPALFAGKADFGTVMGVAAAWSQLTTSLGWFASRYTIIAQWRATTARLNDLSCAIDRDEPDRTIRVEAGSSPTGSIALTNLKLSLPGGDSLADIGSLELQPGDRLMISGPTGAGKSTLIRAIAGLWPFGEGQVQHAAQSKVIFLPQKSYIRSGTLKSALCYPNSEEQFSDDECRRALIACSLPHMTHKIHVSGPWSKTMSLGEQQRLAFVRAWLATPDVLFLDEATSSLDPKTEVKLYAEILERLPNSTIVSVAHRAALREFHSRFLDLDKAVE